MKIFLSSLFIIFVCLTSFAQKVPIADLDLQPDGNFYQRNTPDPFTGVAFENFSNGKKKSKAEFKKGKLHGKVTTWHNTGEKATLVYYKSGTRTGTEVHWFDTGVKKLEINYDDKGLATGICKEYFHSGKLKSEGKYLNGVEEGLHKWYFKNGNLDQTVQYKKGLAQGKVKHYFSAGTLKMEGDYQAGKPNGVVTYFHSNQAKKRELHYTEGQENGLASVWSQRGILLEEREYKNGEETAYRNFRSGAIKTKKGYLQVFNGKNSFYQIHIASDGWVRPRANRDITYVVDNFVLQLLDRPISKFATSAMDEKSTLAAFQTYELKYIEEATQSTISAQKETISYPKGTYLHWWFENPKLKNIRNPSSRTVVEEHYFSFVCGKQILSLYVPKTKGNDIQKIKRSIQKIADSLTVKNKAIDLNQTRQEIRKNAGLPPLPRNEVIKGYENRKKK